tara:strand:+ start:458 stop:1465 length:1008 start_codon:yes stop_codon:yes gene_type:complete
MKKILLLFLISLLSLQLNANEYFGDIRLEGVKISSNNTSNNESFLWRTRIGTSLEKNNSIINILGTFQDDEFGSLNNEDAALERGNVYWKQDWGFVYTGRMPGDFFGNNLLFDSGENNGDNSSFDGIYIKGESLFSETGHLDFIWAKQNNDQTDKGINVFSTRVNLAYSSSDLNFGITSASNNDTNNALGTNEDWSAVFMSTSHQLGKTSLKIEYLQSDGNNGLGANNPLAKKRDSAYLLQLNLPIKENFSMGFNYGAWEPGALLPNWGSMGKGTFIFSDGSINSSGANNPFSKGEIIRYSVRLNSNWEINWDVSKNITSNEKEERISIVFFDNY